MAQGDVNVNVRVDDKGTLKRLDKDAARAARSTNRLGEATAQTNSRRNRFNRLEKGTAGITSNSTKAFAKQAQTLGGTLVPAYAALAANIFAITALFNALSSAARVKQLEEGLLSMGTASGVALGTVSAELKIATENAISLEEAMRAVALASSAGFDSSTIERLGTVAKATSIALGRDTTDALNRLTKGAIKLEPELLDELGIMVRLDDAVEKYASQLGKSANSLTLTERRQAFMNAVLEEGETKFAAVAASVNPNVYDQLGAAVSELGKDFTSFINLIAGPFVAFITQSKLLMTSLILLFGGPVLKQVINSLTGVTSGAQKAAQVAKNIQQENLRSLQATGRTTEKFEALVNAIDKGTVSTQDYQSAIKGLNSDIGKSRKAVEKGGKGVVAKRKELKKLEDTLKATKEAYAQNSVAVIANTEASAFSAIAQGKFITGIKGLIALIKLETVELKANTVGASANATAILYLGFASRVAGVAIRGLVGILAVLTGGFALVAAAAGIFLSFGEKILNFFRTDEQKKYAEETKTLKTATDELSNSFKELDKGFEDSTITTLTGKYSAISNSLKDLDIRFKQLQETGIDKGAKDPRVKTFRKLFEESQSFKDQVKLLPPELQRLANGLNTSNATGENASKVMSALKTVAGGVAEAFVSVAESLKSANDPLQSFINKSKAKTPLDDLAASFAGISKELKLLEERANNLSPEEFAKQLSTLIDENASTALKELITPGEGAEKLMIPVGFETNIGERNLQKVREQGTAIAKRFAELMNAGNKEAAQGLIPIMQQYGALDMVLSSMTEEQRKQYEAGELILETLENQAKTIQEKIAEVNTLIQQSKTDLLNQKRIETTLKSQLKLENRRIQSADRATEIINKEEKLRNNQVSQLETQAKLQRELADAAEKGSDTQKGLLASAERFEAQATALKNEKLNAEEKQLRITKERVAFETKMIDIRKQALDLQLKSAQAAEQILNSQIKIAETEQKINSLKDPTQRGEIRIGDEIALFEKFRKQKEDAAVKEFQLKIQQLQIEEELLKLRLEVIKAELNAALSREDPKSDTAKRIREAMERIDTISGNASSTIQAQMNALGAGLAETLAGIELEGEELANKLRDAFVNATGDMYSRMVGLMQNFGDNVEDRKKNFEEFWDGLGNQEKIQGIIGMVQPMIDQFAELGPEGEVIHKMLMAADMIANAWGLAFDRISSHLDKLFGEIAPTSFEEFKVAWGAMELEDKAAIVGAVATAAAQTMGALADALAAKSQQRVQSIDAEIAAEQKRDGKSAASLAKIAALEKKKEREKRKAFETDKKLRLAQAVMSTAAGIANALTLPIPFNIIMASLIGAMGAAQIATISSMSYQGGNSSVNAGGPGSISVGERKNSVDFARSTAPAGELAYMRGERGQGTGASNFVPGGFAGKQYRAFGGNTGFMVGEQGPEMFIPNRPGTVVPADDTARMGGGGGGMNITFNVSAIDSQGVEDFINGSRGQIIESIREAANSQGEFFLESVDTFDIKSQKFDYSVGVDKR